MGKDTKIPWCHHTFSPWWGCRKVSPGCANCYAERMAGRFGSWWGDNDRRFFGDNHWNEPLHWDRAAAKAGERHRVFCGSMCDVFEDRPELAQIRERLLRLVGATRSLDWLLLTKRPENVLPVFRARGWQNLWLGVTAENQELAYERIPILLDIRATKRFVSIEPILGAIDDLDNDEGYPLGELDWVIVGDESGPGRRPAQLDWVRSIRDQCVGADVPFFFKQWHFDEDVDAFYAEGGTFDESTHRYGKVECPELDGRVWTEVPRG